NHVGASNAKRPWRKQINLILAYLCFYNVFRLAGLILWPFRRLPGHRIGCQLIGIVGLGYTIRRTLGWMFRLMRGPIHRRSEPFRPDIPMRSPAGAVASHDLPSQMASPSRPEKPPVREKTPAVAAASRA
ncbi:MAG: hypothetical protein NTV86_18200, partial [Planctomycetota bacterium]|nr:hypothetical protein [Planctomycetota bacterium]